MLPRIFVFEEPHITGGDARVTIKGQDVLAYMEHVAEGNPKYWGATDKELIDEFKLIFGAWELGVRYA